MKKCLALVLAAILLICVCGCNSGSSQQTIPTETESAVPETTAAETTVPETTIPETTVPTEPELEGHLFLTVSEITFSLVGEEEDIYVGTAPREEITWVSNDESVVTFQDGILTAVGVGSTTVYAEYGDQRIEVIAGCLAQTQEELNALSVDIRRSPKRIPPVVEEPMYEYFDDVGLVGDSITYILFQNETRFGHLGNPTFLTRGGVSLNGFVRYYKNLYWKGAETKIEDVVAASGVKKLFIMLGNNDLHYRTLEDTMESWEIMLGRILEKSPDVEIYIQSCAHEWTELNSKNTINDTINEYNKLLIQFCEDNGYHYVDVQQYFVDHTNRMAEEYSLDHEIHLGEEGCLMWMRALNAYAQLRLLGGNGL